MTLVRRRNSFPERTSGSWKEGGTSFEMELRCLMGKEKGAVPGILKKLLRLLFIMCYVPFPMVAFMEWGFELSIIITLDTDAFG